MMHICTTAVIPHIFSIAHLYSILNILHYHNCSCAWKHTKESTQLHHHDSQCSLLTTATAPDLVMCDWCGGGTELSDNRCTVHTKCQWTHHTVYSRSHKINVSNNHVANNNMVHFSIIWNTHTQVIFFSFRTATNDYVQYLICQR